jgi:hypothetical protein
MCSLKNGLINIWIEVEMKKFRLVSNLLMDKDRGFCSKYQFVEADSFDEVIQEIESNAGWYTGINGAFKVAYIEEVVE